MLASQREEEGTVILFISMQKAQIGSENTVKEDVMLKPKA